MRLFLQRRLEDPGSKSIFGTLAVENDAPSYVTCEREWLNNAPSLSCVPGGFYRLTRHDGTKYQRTFALIGETVSHAGGEPGVTRSACVLHWATQGKYLEGCISIGDVLHLAGLVGSLDGKPKGRALLDELRGLSDHYLTIRDCGR